MKNLLTSLKKLGKKMTGDDVAGVDLVTVVDNIADGYTGGGGSGGGSGVFIIDAHMSDDFEDQYNVILDSELSNINNAIENNCFIVLRLSVFGGLQIQQFVHNSLAVEQKILSFSEAAKTNTVVMTNIEINLTTGESRLFQS